MKNHIAAILAGALVFSASAVYASCTVSVSADPKTETVKVTALFDNDEKVSVSVFNANFTVNAVVSQKYNDEMFKRDFDTFSVKSDADKKLSIDYVKQLAKPGAFSYKSNGDKGRYAAYAVSETGESAFKYFTYIKESDYPAVLEEFNLLKSAAETENFIAYYEDVFFSNPNYSQLNDESRTLIAKELFGRKENYKSVDEISSDYILNADVLKFYELKETTDAVKFIVKNADLLGIADIDKNFLSANDTYKSSIAEYIRKKGAECYNGWRKVFAEAANQYGAGITEQDSGNGSGSKGGSGGGKKFSAPSNETNNNIWTVQSVWNDMDLSHWAYESVLRLNQRGVVSGYGNKNFCPDNNITRAEFLKIVLSATEIDIKGIDCTFKDVSKDDWFYSFAATAQKTEIANGDLYGNFSPNDKISRQDAVKILYNAAMFKTYAMKENREYTEFIDGESIADYAKTAVKQMYCANVINGYSDQSFKPTAYVTRAESAKMVFSFLQSAV